uniref:Uncharacterized protein n=1 Tax=Physcomitrium patens TaxID=3218 RepID=A0A7I4CDW0_PHYPA
MIVDNKVGISILQYPQEKDQHLRTGRTAGLSLRNVQDCYIKSNADFIFSNARTILEYNHTKYKFVGSIITLSCRSVGKLRIAK